MENLYIVNQDVDHGEYCYVIRAKTINHALAYYMSRKRGDGACDYKLEVDKDNIKIGTLLDEFNLPHSKFTIQKLGFDSTNVTFIGGYEE